MLTLRRPLPRVLVGRYSLLREKERKKKNKNNKNPSSSSSSSSPSVGEKEPFDPSAFVARGLGQQQQQQQQLVGGGVQGVYVPPSMPAGSAEESKDAKTDANDVDAPPSYSSSSPPIHPAKAEQATNRLSTSDVVRIFSG